MGKYFKKFVNRILKDFKQKELMPVKILFFVQMSTILVLYPYLTIHMRELGISIEETAIMSAVTPVVGILLPPLAGLLADKIGNFKIMLALFSAFSGLSALLLLLVPTGRVTITYPDKVVLDMSCTSNKPLVLSLYEDNPCDINSDLIETSLNIESCGFICHAYLDNYDADALQHSTFYQIQMHNIEENTTISTKYVNRQPLFGVLTALNNTHNLTHNTKLKNDENYRTSIRKLSKNSYYFPSENLFDFECKLQSASLEQYNHTVSNEYNFDIPTEYYFCKYTNETGFQVTKNVTIGFLSDRPREDDMFEKRKVFMSRFIRDKHSTNHNLKCLEGYGHGKEYISVNVDLNRNGLSYKNLDLGVCTSRCLATAKRADVCKNSKQVIEYDVQLTFWTYLSVRVFIGIIGGTAYTMFEGAVIAILREYKADYGLQRMYASLGGMISSPLSGLLIDYASKGKGYTDFKPIFFLYCGLKVASAVLMLFINLEFKTPAKSVVADVKSLMNLELTSLFIAAFLLGSAWGYIESFLFWLLEDLGGTKSLMGLTITVGGILGIPLLAVSGPIIKRFGHANVIFIGFLTYAIRLFGYSMIYNPWLSLIFEAMECLTHSLCFTALVTYAAKLSSITTDTTIQGIIGGLFHGVGKSAGSLVGGYLIKYFGMRGTFQMFAAVTGMTAFIYLAFYHLYIKKYSELQKKEAELEKEKTNPSNDLKDIAKEKSINNTVDAPIATIATNTNLGYLKSEEDKDEDGDDDIDNDKGVINQNVPV